MISLTFLQLELLSQKCVILLKYIKMPSFRCEALWHSSKFRLTDSHSAGSSASCTCFVSPCQINRTSTHKNNFPVIVLGNTNRWRNYKKNYFCQKPLNLPQQSLKRMRNEVALSNRFETLFELSSLSVILITLAFIFDILVLPAQWQHRHLWLTWQCSIFTHYFTKARFSET